MIELLPVIINGVRLWGFIAGVICLTDVFDQTQRFVHPSATLFLAVFLILTGIVIPLSLIVAPIIEATPIFALLVLLAWLSISSAGWLKVCAGRRLIMKAAALVSLVLTIIASFVMV